MATDGLTAHEVTADKMAADLEVIFSPQIL